MRIDPEFRALIPALQPGERQQLEANLLAHGCRDPLVTWRGTLIDGHNRYEICERLSIRYRTVEMVLPSRAHVLLWIEENQLGRRNLTDDQRSAIGHAVKKRRAALSRAQQAREVGKLGGRGKKRTHEAGASPRVSERARPAVAKAARVSERKLRAVAEIEKKNPAAIAEIRSGEKTIAQVRTEMRRGERIERIAKLAAPAPMPADQKFPVIYADPPWKYEYTETEARAIENQYPTMDLAAICALPICDLATADAMLFLWVTSPKLVEGLEVIKAWGFEYRTSMIWVKPQIGMGYYARQQHEFLLIAKRGSPPTPAPADRPNSVIVANRGDHSSKPAEFYEAIERMYSAFPRIELFARAARDGWARWGNQADDADTASSA